MGPGELGGVIPAIPTPFTPTDEQVDEDALRRVVRHVVDGGVHGIMTTGGTGEFPHLVARGAPARRRGRGRGDRGRGADLRRAPPRAATWEAIALTEDAAAAGADAAILVPPFYFGIPDESLHGFFADLAGAGILPIVVYNNPLYTGNALSPGADRRADGARQRDRAQAVGERPRASSSRRCGSPRTAGARC